MLTTQPKAVPQRNDMQNCFGFDDEDEDDDEPEDNTKPNIHVLQSAMHWRYVLVVSYLKAQRGTCFSYIFGIGIQNQIIKSIPEYRFRYYKTILKFTLAKLFCVK